MTKYRAKKGTVGWKVKLGFVLLPERRCTHCSCIKIACCVCGHPKPGITLEMQEKEAMRAYEESIKFIK